MERDLGGEVMKMESLFDITKFDSYKEDNRREVKREMEDCQVHCGIPIPPLQTAMEVS